MSVFVDDADVKDKDFPGKSDPYCRVNVGSHEEETSIKSNTNHPTWRETLELGCVYGSTSAIRVRCWDYDSFSSDDDLIDETLEADVWYVNGMNGQGYTLGGKYNVKIEVSWLTGPTASPSAEPTTSSPTLKPTLGPTLSATFANPSPLPTSRSPTPLPTSVEIEGEISALQVSDSRLYDVSSALACYDSPRLGLRVEIVDVRLIAVSGSFFLSTKGGGPWSGLRVITSSFDDDDFTVKCFASVRGKVLEIEGETTLGNVVFQGERTCDASEEVIDYYPVEIADFAGSCDLGVFTESLEGIPLEILSTQEAVVVDRFFEKRESVILLNDKNGGRGGIAVVSEAAHLRNVSLNVGDQLVINHLSGLLVYEHFLDSPSYALRAMSMDFVKVGNFTEVPSPVPSQRPTTPAPSARPTVAPTKRPSALPTSAPSAAPLSLSSSSTSRKNKRAARASLFVFIVVAILLVLLALGYSYRRRARPGIIRRPYDKSRKPTSVTEQTFEMGVVEVLEYDPALATAHGPAATLPRDFRKLGENEDHKEDYADSTAGPNPFV